MKLIFFPMGRILLKLDIDIYIYVRLTEYNILLRNIRQFPLRFRVIQRTLPKSGTKVSKLQAFTHII